MKCVFVLAFAAASVNAANLRATGPEPGVGTFAEYGHLLPYNPDGMPESVMKTRCTNFVNHLLEKSAYPPALVGDVMPKCAWSKKECGALKKDLMTRLAKKDKSL